MSSIDVPPNSRQGRLVFTGKRVGYKLECLCDCGKTKLISAYHFRKGNTNSCGCLNSELSSKRRKTHGMSRSKLYNVWNAMLDRCSNSKNEHYKEYGGRGITVCDEWRKFENFYADMGDQPFPGATIDRKDPNGNYEPNNVRWATMATQRRNRRDTKLIKFRGESKCLKDWADSVGIDRKTLGRRLKNGWPLELAFTKPPNSNRRIMASRGKNQSPPA